ncbi:hypothetical protein [Methylobacterium sp. Leaf125]|uniref:hypothetical protein n=1 Tax=Methylobacterium sp. Leaf125 TaxID=1736265 RepID=UPI000A73F304|nr:hypothetical protein [Methylobacterium sp. Leaf125]
MANKIELLNRDEATKLAGILSRNQRILTISGDHSGEIEQWLQQQSSGFDSIIAQNRDGSKILCLIVPEFYVPQTDCVAFNANFMIFKQALYNVFDDWQVPQGFKAVWTSRF